MTLLEKILLTLGTAAFMEFVAWWSHKYIMHGWGWAWHKDHHEPHDNALEKNDLFAIVGMSMAITLFCLGAFVWAPLWYVGLGVTIYGAIYAFVHDGLVHQRWPFKFVPQRGYFKRLVQAHKVHHAMQTKDVCVSFGFVWAHDPQKLHARLMEKKRAHQAMQDNGDTAIT